MIRLRMKALRSRTANTRVIEGLAVKHREPFKGFAVSNIGRDDRAKWQSLSVDPSEYLLILSVVVFFELGHSASIPSAEIRCSKLDP